MFAAHALFASDEIALDEIVNDLREYSSHDKIGQPLIFAGEIVDSDEKKDVYRAPSLKSEYFEDNIACSHYLHEHLRAVWFSPDLKQRMCYYCAESATDRGHRLVGGLPQFQKSREWSTLTSSDDVVYKLNAGEEMIVSLSKLKCPCSTPFRNSTQSAFCSMCCTATCSAACHKIFCQDAGMCFYHHNYIFETQSDIYGCRDIRWCVIERSTPGTYLSRVCGPRYLEAIKVQGFVASSFLIVWQGKDGMSLIVRRGYCQYGQVSIGSYFGLLLNLKWSAAGFHNFILHAAAKEGTEAPKSFSTEYLHGKSLMQGVNVNVVDFT